MGVGAVAQWGHGPGFQGIAIALALRDPNFLAHYADLFKYGYFEHDALITLARLVQDYYAQYQKAPSRDILIAEVMQYCQRYGVNEGTQATLMQWISWIYEVDLATDGEYVRDSMVEFGRRQALKGAVSKLLTILETPNEDLNLGQVRSIVDDALRVGALRSAGMDFGAVALSLPEMLQGDSLYGQATKVPTGLSAIDSRLRGGMGAGEIFVVLASTGGGKSTFMVNMGRAALQHFATAQQARVVIHVTLELKEVDIALKYGCTLSGCTVEEVQAGSPAYHTNIARVLPYIQDRLRIAYFSPGTLSVEELHCYIGTLCSQEGLAPGLIIVDYADELRMDSRRGLYEGMGDVYRSLIRLADAYQCPVVTGSQANRSSSRDGVVLKEGMGDSWRKAERADGILAINQTVHEYEHGGLRVILTKLRRGQNLGTIYCHADYARASIWEMDPKAAEAFVAKVAAAAKGGRHELGGTAAVASESQSNGVGAGSGRS